MPAHQCTENTYLHNACTLTGLSTDCRVILRFLWTPECWGYEDATGRFFIITYNHKPSLSESVLRNELRFRFSIWDSPLILTYIIMVDYV